MGVSPYPGAYVCKKNPFEVYSFPPQAFLLYDNSIVSPVRPMGGELSFYLDLPSWELTKIPSECAFESMIFRTSRLVGYVMVLVEGIYGCFRK